jgi:hypothetical protein
MTLDAQSRDGRKSQPLKATLRKSIGGGIVRHTDINHKSPFRNTAVPKCAQHRDVHASPDTFGGRRAVAMLYRSQGLRKGVLESDGFPIFILDNGCHPKLSLNHL